MRARSITGLLSVVSLLALGASACADTAPGERVATREQALANGCRLPTLGAACDPDGDGPATPCDGVCVADGKSISGADCVHTDWSANEGMPCGGLDKDKIECVRSCRGGQCTATIADDEAPCMPSGSPYFSAVCEGACLAGGCIKLAKPKDCPVTPPDTGSGGVEDAGSAVDEDTGSTSSGGEDTGVLGTPNFEPGPSGNFEPIDLVLRAPLGQSADAGATPANDPNAGAPDGDPGSNGGCGCRTAPAPSPWSSAASVVGIALAVAGLRARRRR